MNDDPEAPGDPGEESEDATSDQGERAERGLVFRGSIPSLDAFAAIQRSLASFDFSAIQAAQRAFEQPGAFKKIIEAQEVIAKNFARSIVPSRRGSRTPASTRRITSLATPPRTPSVMPACSHRSPHSSR